MTERIRRPALAPPPIRPAPVRTMAPTAELERHFGRVWQTRMGDLPFVNPALGVAAIGFRRYEGDWLGVMVTPWFLNLFLMSGGGTLWRDVPAGERCRVDLPCGTLQFIADDDAELGPYQYCPLIAPVSHLPDMAAALAAAASAIAAVLAPPPAEPEACAASPASTCDGPDRSTPTRRDFFRRLAGVR